MHAGMVGDGGAVRAFPACGLDAQAKKKPPEGGLLTYAIQKGEGMDGLQGEPIFAPASLHVCRREPRPGVAEPLLGEAAIHTARPSRRGSRGGSRRLPASRPAPARCRRWSFSPLARNAPREGKPGSRRQGKYAWA